MKIFYPWYRHHQDVTRVRGKNGDSKRMEKNKKMSNENKCVQNGDGNICKKIYSEMELCNV